MSAINVPLPGPSSIIQMGEELPVANHRVKNQTAISYRERQQKLARELDLAPALSTYLSEHLTDLGTGDKIPPSSENLA